MDTIDSINSKLKEIVLPNDYVPTNEEKFMCENHRNFFKMILLKWKKDILEEGKKTLDYLSDDDNKNCSDDVDMASLEQNNTLELRARNRQFKLITKIDRALDKISNGTYGYCEDTEEPIDIRRLIARPIATLSIEAQERHEARER